MVGVNMLYAMVNLRIIDQVERRFRRNKIFVSLAFFIQDVSNTTNGVNEFLCKWIVDLAPQPADGNIDHVGITVEVYVPDLFRDERAGQNLPFSSRQQRQQRELFRRQVKRTTGTGRFVSE